MKFIYRWVKKCFINSGRKDGSEMNFETSYKNILNCETTLQGVYEKLQDMLDDNRTKKLVSDLEEKAAKELKLLREGKINAYKKDEQILCFEEAKQGSEIPRYEEGSDKTAEAIIEHLLDYEEKLRAYYFRIQKNKADTRIKDLFERMSQLKKEQVRLLKELKEVYASVI